MKNFKIQTSWLSLSSEFEIQTPFLFNFPSHHAVNSSFPFLRIRSPTHTHKKKKHYYYLKSEGNNNKSKSKSNPKRALLNFNGPFFSKRLHSFSLNTSNLKLIFSLSFFLFSFLIINSAKSQHQEIHRSLLLFRSVLTLSLALFTFPWNSHNPNP